MNLVYVHAVVRSSLLFTRPSMSTVAVEVDLLPPPPHLDMLSKQSSLHNSSDEHSILNTDHTLSRDNTVSTQY
jgi:hypothetical protein